MSNRWETGRTEGFSDGVFAIAITLLVLETAFPSPRSTICGAASKVAAVGYLVIAIVAVLRARGEEPESVETAEST